MNLVKGVIMKTIGELVGIDSEYQDSIEIVYDPTEIAEVTRRAIELHRETRKPRYTAKELWKKITGKPIGLIGENASEFAYRIDLYGNTEVLLALEYVYVHFPGELWDGSRVFNYIDKVLQGRRADAEGRGREKTLEDLHVDTLTNHLRKQGRALTTKASIQDALRRFGK